MTLSLYKYENSFEFKFKKDMEYTNKNASLYNNDFYKINNNRLIFVTKDDKLYFYLFDLFDNYSKIIINIYEYALTGYSISKDIAFYYFNEYIYFTATVAYENIDTFSLLITFGYSN